MHKTLFRSGSLAAVLVLASLAAPRIEADLPEVKTHGALRVLAVANRTNDEFFSSESKTDRPGFDREILEGFANLHRIKLEITHVSNWDDLIPTLKEKKGDLVAGRFTATGARRQVVAFTVEVFPTRNVVVTRKPTPPVHALEQLRALRVGTVKGTSLAAALAEAGIPMTHVDDSIASGKLPDALKEGKVKAVVLGVENAISAQRDDPALELGMFLGPACSLAYAVRKEDTALLAALNEYIENVKRTATYSRLVVKYFGEAALDALKRARAQ